LVWSAHKTAWPFESPLTCQSQLSFALFESLLAAIIFTHSPKNFSMVCVCHCLTSWNRTLQHDGQVETECGQPRAEVVSLWENRISPVLNYCSESACPVLWVLLLYCAKAKGLNPRPNALYLVDFSNYMPAFKLILGMTDNLNYEAWNMSAQTNICECIHLNNLPRGIILYLLNTQGMGQTDKYK